MAYRISVGASGTSALGVLEDARGTSIEARAAIAPLEPVAGTLACLGRLAEALGHALPDLLKGTETILLETGIAREVVAARAGARVGTIATRGFRTRFVFQPVPCRGDEGDRPPVGVPLFLLSDDHRMTEVGERVDAGGNVLAPLDEESVVQAARYLKRQGVESIAVLLLFSPLHPEHEQRVGEIVADELPGVHVATSSAVLPSLGEFRRWSATLLGAYVAPRVSRYVADLGAALAANGFGGELRFVGPGRDPVTPDAVVENPTLLLHAHESAVAGSGAPEGLPAGFRDLLSVAAGEARFRVGFHPGREARKGCDGSPGIGFAVATADAFWADVEHCEALCPVVVEELRLLEDGEGAGEYRGAPGVCLELTLRAAAELTVHDGDDELLLCGPEGIWRPLRSGGPHRVFPGARCIARCRGSAGWGRPLDRAVSEVQRDVIGGYVSVQRARDVYGVVLNPSTLELQCDATAKLREGRRSRGRKRRNPQRLAALAGPRNGGENR